MGTVHRASHWTKMLREQQLRKTGGPGSGDRQEPSKNSPLTIPFSTACPMRVNPQGHREASLCLGDSRPLLRTHCHRGWASSPASFHWQREEPKVASLLKGGQSLHHATDKHVAYSKINDTNRQTSKSFLTFKALI